VPSVRLGLFGGTFDPPHLGHLVVAQDVADVLSLDRVMFVPAGEPPHKTAREVSPAPVRLEMVHALVDGDERFGVSAFEVEKGGASYTVETLEHFRALHPDAELYFVMGADQAAAFDTRQDPGRIVSLATLVVMDREGTMVPSVQFLPVSVTRVDISATDIRQRVRNGRSVRYLVPDRVREIIERSRLYRAES